ncbi:MAG: hypothetical protein FWE24_01400 [Defluviitaleaceae bacterium]|nr:hypothetical protein [Defluviitaleaceae bacterium]
MSESKIKSTILLYGTCLILLSFTITTIVILGNGLDFLLVIFSGLFHLVVLIFNFICSAVVAKKIYSSFTAFLGEANLDCEDIAPMGQFLDLAGKAFSTSPPTLIKVDMLEGKSKNIAKEINKFINELHSMELAIDKTLAITPALRSGKKAERLLVLINSLVDDLEGVSKGTKPKGHYDSRLSQVFDEIFGNYAELIESRKALNNTLEALKKNNANQLPKDMPIGIELMRIFGNISSIEGALVRLAEFELENGCDNLPKDFKSADIIRNILNQYKASLQDVFNTLSLANNLSDTMANETKILTTAKAEEKRLMVQLRDLAKNVNIQLKSGSHISGASSKVDNILQLIEKIDDNKIASSKYADNMSAYVKEISKNLDLSLKSITKFKFKRELKSFVRNPIAAGTHGILPEKTADSKLGRTSSGAASPAMLPRHYGKVPESGYNFDSKDYGKYSR